MMQVQETMMVWWWTSVYFATLFTFFVAMNVAETMCACCSSDFLYGGCAPITYLGFLFFCGLMDSCSRAWNILCWNIQGINDSGK